MPYTYARYMLNDKKEVVECTDQEFFAWNQTLPEDERSSVGCRLKQDYIGKTLVSTVFLSLDHGWNSPVPIVFETMVFVDPDVSMLEADADRYATYDEAMAGHERILAEWKQKLEVTDAETANHD